MKRTLAILSLGAFIMTAGAQSVITTAPASANAKNAWTAEKGQCMASAVEKRDNSIISAVDTFNGSMKSALGARKDAVKAVWNTADSAARQTARKSAEATFKTSVKAAHEKVRSDRKAAWSTFDSDANTCGFKNHGEKLEIVNVPVAY